MFQTGMFDNCLARIWLNQARKARNPIVRGKDLPRFVTRQQKLVEAIKQETRFRGSMIAE